MLRILEVKPAILAQLVDVKSWLLGVSRHLAISSLRARRRSDSRMVRASRARRVELRSHSDQGASSLIAASLAAAPAIVATAWLFLRSPTVPSPHPQPRIATTQTPAADGTHSASSGSGIKSSIQPTLLELRAASAQGTPQALQAIDAATSGLGGGTKDKSLRPMDAREFLLNPPQ